MAMYIVEIVLIQRFNLYLGNPAYALTVVLLMMLLASGVDGLVAGRWQGRRAVIPMLIVVCMVLAVVGAVVSRLIYETIAVLTVMKIMIVVAFIAPVAFVMRMPFPTRAVPTAGRSTPKRSQRAPTGKSNPLDKSTTYRGGVALDQAYETPALPLSYTARASAMVGPAPTSVKQRVINAVAHEEAATGERILRV